MADRAGLRPLSSAAGMADRQRPVGRPARPLLSDSALRHRRPARRGRHRPQPHESLDARASVQGHCEYLKERFPEPTPLHVVLAYDVRQFEDKRRQYNPALPNPVLHLSSRDLAQHAAGVYAANGIARPHPAARQQALPGHAGAVVHHPLLASARRPEHLRLAQSARRQRRQVLRRARRPARAAGRSDHGRPRRSGDAHQGAAVVRGAALRPRSLSRYDAAPRLHRPVPQAEPDRRRRETRTSRSSSRRCTASVR